MKLARPAVLTKSPLTWIIDVPSVTSGSEPQPNPTAETIPASSSSTDNPSSDNPNLPPLDVDKFFTYLDRALGTDQLNIALTEEDLQEVRTRPRSVVYGEPNPRSSAPRSATPTAPPRPWNPHAVNFDEQQTGVMHPRPTSPNRDQPLSIPPGARWTKIDRQIVSAQALEEANERFEMHGNFVVVLRVLSREEITGFAERTREIRKRREELREMARGMARSIGQDVGRGLWTSGS